MLKKYSFLSHAADIRLRVYGKTVKELFKNAGLGLFSFLFPSPSVPLKPASIRKIKIKGIDKENLLVNWLNELLYISSAKRLTPITFAIRKLSRNNLESEICFKKTLPSSHFTHEVKAVTYHNLKIKKSKSGYLADIIIDI